MPSHPNPAQKRRAKRSAVEIAAYQEELARRRAAQRERAEAAVEKRRRVGSEPAILETCDCLACVNLRVELGRGWRFTRFYGYKLLVYGWAGPVSEAERAYIHAHAPWYASFKARGWGGRLKGPTS